MLSGVKSLLWQSQPALDAAKGWGASFLQSLGGEGRSGGGSLLAASAATPPWAGLDPGTRDRVLAISRDAGCLLRDPPPGSGFQFDLESALPTAAAAIDGDESLRRMRFELVPRRLSEEQFWRNYFYRVSLIRRSAQLSAAPAQQQQPQQPEAHVPSPAAIQQPLPTSVGLASPHSASGSCDSFERLDCDDAEWELELAGVELATPLRRAADDIAK